MLCSHTMPLSGPICEASLSTDSVFLLSEFCVSRGVAALKFYLTAHRLIQVALKYHLPYDQLSVHCGQDSSVIGYSCEDISVFIRKILCVSAPWCAPGEGKTKQT